MLFKLCMLRRLYNSITERIAEEKAKKVMTEFIKSADGRSVVFKKSDGRLIWEYRKDEEGNPKVYVGSAYNEPTDDSEILFLEKSGEIYKDPETGEKWNTKDMGLRNERK